MSGYINSNLRSCFSILATFFLVSQFAAGFTIPTASIQRTPVLFSTASDFIASVTDSEKWQADLFTEKTVNVISANVKKHIHLPIPGPVVDLAVNEVAQKLGKDLSRDLLLELRVAIEAESTSDNYDDASTKDLDDLAARIAAELDETVKFHLIPQKLQLTETIVRTILYVLCTSDGEWKKARIKYGLSTSKDLLSEEGRKTLAKALNAQVDIPFMNEAKEQKHFEKALASVADKLQAVIPPGLIERLEGESQESLEEVKDHLVETVQQSLHMPFIPKESQEWLVKSIVEFHLDNYIGNTEAELLFMDSTEQKEQLLDIKANLELDLKMLNDKYEKSQANINARLKKLDSRIASLDV